MTSGVLTRRGRGWPRASREAGFTLIELGLVILILGVILAITLPRLGNRAYAQLDSETRKLALAFRYLRHAAILNGRTYRLMYDLDSRSYWAEVSQVTEAPVLDEQESEFAGSFFPPPIEEQFALDLEGPLTRRRLPEPLGFSDVELPETWGKIMEGVVFTTFYPDGYVDISVVHLDNGQDVFSLYVPNGITGQVFVSPGYLSWSG